MRYWQKWNSDITKKPIWMIGLLLGVIFLLIGIGEEQLQRIYQKAVMVCLECIGIG